nr:hypothetical protein [uncultured Brevundimonas sp.]
MTASRSALKDIFFHTRLVGRRWNQDLLQLAFVSGGGDVVLSTFVWSPVSDIETDRVIDPSILRLLGKSTPSLGFMLPMIEQICRGANMIALDIERQRRLLSPKYLDMARGLRSFPSDLADLVREGPLTDEPVAEAIDRHQDAVTVTFRLLYLWSGARPEALHMPMLHDRWEGLQRIG